MFLYVRSFRWCVVFLVYILMVHLRFLVVMRYGGGVVVTLFCPLFFNLE